MHRQRAEQPGTRRYKNGEQFLESEPKSGFHAVQVGAQWLDLLFEDRQADRTLISFHGSATKRIVQLPYFTGRSLAAELGWNLIAVSDPSLALGDIDLAWFLGNRSIGHLRHRLSPLIRHLVNDTHPVLFGGSGGAYAAMNFGQDFPDSSVVVFNPRLNLSARPSAPVSRYLEVCHQTTRPLSPRGIRRRFITEDVGSLYTEGLPFDLHVIQNAGDTVYIRHQFEPFVSKFADDPRLNIHVEDFGAGHRAIIPPEFLRNYLTSLRPSDQKELTADAASIHKPV